MNSNPQEVTEEEKVKAKEWLKKVFKGEVLDGFLERARVKEITEFEKEAEGSTLVKSLIGEKDGETLIVGLLRDGERVRFITLCEKPKEVKEHICHARTVEDGELYEKVKTALGKIEYEVKEVNVEGGESQSS